MLFAAYLHIVKLLQPDFTSRWNISAARNQEQVKPWGNMVLFIQVCPPPPFPTEHNELSMLVFETPPVFPVLGTTERSRL